MFVGLNEVTIFQVFTETKSIKNHPFFLIGVCSSKTCSPGLISLNPRKDLREKGVKLGLLKKKFFSTLEALGSQEKKEEDSREKRSYNTVILHLFLFLIGLVVWSALSYFQGI